MAARAVERAAALVAHIVPAVGAPQTTGAQTQAAEPTGEDRGDAEKSPTTPPQSTLTAPGAPPTEGNPASAPATAPNAAPSRSTLVLGAVTGMLTTHLARTLFFAALGALCV